MAQRDFIPLVEAAYSFDSDESAWLTGVCRAAQPLLGRELGVAAIHYDATKEDYVEILGTGGVDVHDGVFGALFNVPDMPEHERKRMVRIFRNRLTATAQGEWNAIPAGREFMRASLAAAGVPGADMLAVNAASPSHRGCLIATFSPERIAAPLSLQAQWERAAAHISTALRMRQRLGALKSALLTESPEAEAILDPNGKAAHATGFATTGDALERLRTAVAVLERSRRAQSRDPEEALALREALVDGRWSVLDCFERDGRRYWVAHKNEPDVPAVRALSDRERQVAAYAVLGQSNKMIAYELGLSRSSVALHLRSARAKLGVSSRVGLVRALATHPGAGGAGAGASHSGKS